MENKFLDFKKEFFSYVDGSNNITITSHYSPDDDSIGSVLSMYKILSDKYHNKNIRIIYEGQTVERYSIFCNFEKIEWVNSLSESLAGTDLLVMLDASQYSRFSKASGDLHKVPTTICIDHHSSESDNFSLIFKDPSFSSNSEIILTIFKEDYILDKNLAEVFLLGILGDTGGLAFVKPAQSIVFLTVKKLLDIVGTSISEFRSKFSSIPVKVIPLLQELVKNTSYEKIEEWPPLQYAFIDRGALSKNNYSDEDISAASHIYLSQYLPRVEGYGWGFVLTPRNDGSCRMSSRSLPNSVNVRDFHEKMGIGGGHDRASGGYFSESNVKECLSKVLDWIKNNKPLIN